MRITATLIARDEGHRIARCLESLGWVNEIVVVVDDRTVDDTVAVSRKFTEHVHVRPFEDFAQQRQWALDQSTGEWILWVDSDEVVTPELASEMREAVTRVGAVAYRTPRQDYMFGKWIRHGGWYPQYHVRLFRRTAGRWTAPVHERFQVDGEIGTLQHAMLHFSHERVADWVAKMDKYTTPEAEQLAASGKRVTWWQLLVEPPAYFGYKYLVQQGWRDGMHGLVLAGLLGCYRLVRNVKWWDLQQQKERSPDPTPYHPSTVNRPAR